MSENLKVLGVAKNVKKEVSKCHADVVDLLEVWYCFYVFLWIREFFFKKLV